MILGELAVRGARRYPKKVAIVFEGKRITFADFNDRVNRLANGLMSITAPGNKVAVLSLNSSQVLEIALGLAKIGMVYAPINYRFTPTELPYVINDSEASILFVGSEFLDTIESIRKELKNLKFVIPIEGQAKDGSYEKLLQQGASNEPEVPVREEDLYAIFYTSGTTGKPKGVMLTHKNVLSMLVNHVYHYEFKHDDVIVHIMPFYHTMQFTLALDHLYVGATSVVTRRFDPKEFLTLVEQERGTNTTLPPAALLALLNEMDRGKYDVTSLRTVAFGGQVMPTEVLRRGLQKMGQIFTNVYGLTETCSLSACISKHLLVPEGEGSRLLGSIGKEMINCHIRIVDERGNEIKPGEMGEITIKADNVMQGYWKLPEETQSVLKGGWLHTGDMATVDEEGYIYIRDRKKELIISGAENIAPREIEEVLYKHPAVNECAVIGVPDTKWGEAVKAVVVLREGKAATERELIDFCGKSLADFKRPKSVEFLAALPKDPVGKIQKKVLREKFWKGQDRRI